MKIYRVWKHQYNRSTELVFLTSFNKAVDYVMAQLKGASNLSGHDVKTDRWTHKTDMETIRKTLREGWWWSVTAGGYVLDGSYSIEIISVEN